MMEGANDQFVEQIARSARLYQRGLITAQEFTNVTLEDLHRLAASHKESSQ